MGLRGFFWVISLFCGTVFVKMADDDGNEDQWLYGDSIQENPDVDSPEKNLRISIDEKADNINISEDTQDEFPVPEPAHIPAPILNNGIDDSTEEKQTKDNANAVNGTGSSILIDDEEEDEDSDDDDDVCVIINDIKTSPTYTSLNIKRGGILTSGGDKLKQPGRFSVEEFEGVGSINGVPAHEFNLDSLEEKPWRKPGADITDYFNYGFNEETWRSYCERQKRIRIQESGVGLGTTQKAGPPPGRKVGGTIDVIGGGGLASRRTNEIESPPKENVIQVMTADRREYSRKQFPDMSVPPPPAGLPSRIPTYDLPPPPHRMIPTTFVPPPAAVETTYEDFYSTEPDYYHNYEPTQDSQWNDPTWQPTPAVSDVKVISPVVSSLKSVVSNLSADSLNQDSMNSEDVSLSGSIPNVAIKEERDDIKDRSRDRSDRYERSDRHRERSHRHRDLSHRDISHRDLSHRDREKSRSRSAERRSRRHKSRSRSPGHRSHRKKKSRRTDREKSKEASE